MHSVKAKATRFVHVEEGVHVEDEVAEGPVGEIRQRVRLQAAPPHHSLPHGSFVLHHFGERKGLRLGAIDTEELGDPREDVFPAQMSPLVMLGAWEQRNRYGTRSITAPLLLGTQHSRNPAERELEKIASRNLLLWSDMTQVKPAPVRRAPS
jgi:hypothetical protein